MARNVALALLLALGAPAAAKQPPTAEGAVSAREKLVDKTTPIGMVIKLLKDLTAKVEGQGKNDAAQYDKFACFCKEQADNKQYGIEKSTKKIKLLGAKIDELGDELLALATEISNLGKEILALETDINHLDGNRTAEHEVYKTNSAEFVAAIDACGRAIEALKDSKAALEGKTKREVAFTQVNAAATAVNAVARKGFIVLTAEQQSALNELANTGKHQGPTASEAYAAKYHSNEVITMLDDLLGQFTQEKNDLDEAEFKAKKLYDNVRLTKSNEKQFAEEDKKEKEAESAAKTAEKEAAEEDKYVEQRSKDADGDFMRVLQGECEDKARLWDQRSKMRTGELQALADAIEALESGVAPNWKANRRLNDLQLHKVASFLQLRGRGKEGKREQVLEVLKRASARLHSGVLAMASLRVQASEDHFVRVRQLLKDLIEHLQSMAQAELNAKQACDTNVRNAVIARDDAAATAETHDKDKAFKEAEANQLTYEIAELSEQIAANKKALLEATQLRAAESADNAQVLQEARDGLAAVDTAIGILDDFYNGGGFLQKAKKQAPSDLINGTRYDELRFKSTDSDRKGKTVADLAPKVFDDEYDGQQEASGGIIGTLQVIKSDFERTIETTDNAETQAANDFTEFKNENIKDTGLKDGAKTTKSNTLTTVEDRILTLAGDLSDAREDHRLAKDTLESLREACVEKEETYAERVAKREQEIEALKEAHAILEDWENQ